MRICTMKIFFNFAFPIDWMPSSLNNFDPCPENKETVLIFGATSMLGKYVVENFNSHTKDICLISYSRSVCKECTLTVRGDFRDARLIQKVLDFYKPKTLITSVKPPLLNTHYKIYIEVNLLSMIQLINAYKEFSIEQNEAVRFIYVSSIAAAGHYFEHSNAKESDPKPFYTDYEAPYDVSKRFAEDYLLNAATENFQVLSLRIGGVIGGKGDPYDYMRWPILFKIDPAPAPIDSNYAGNIAEALWVIYNSGTRGFGRFYYYTGEPLTETEKINIVQEVTGKPIVSFGYDFVSMVVDLWFRFKWDPNSYTDVDLYRMGLVAQSFDQTLFFNTFPEFKPIMSLAKSVRLIYSN
eukprot:maker-scaffold_1-snap-gene-9.17-mRNA-1 protein AED:0.24 eAED:0.24 QI:0/0/0/0.5/1/1/2/0/351